MTEKRFYLLNYKNNPIYDSLEDKEYSAQFKKQRQNLCDKLNEQHETIKELIDALNQRTEQLDGYQKKVTETLQKHYNQELGLFTHEVLEKIAVELGVELK